MSRVIPVKFGPRSTDVDIEGKKFSELAGILATLHDTEVPENVEVFANNQPIQNLDVDIPTNIDRIEITAVAGAKQGR